MTTLEVPLRKQTKAAVSANEILAANWTDTQLTLTDPDLPFQVYEEIGAFLGVLRDRSAWGLGDWIIFGDDVYGEKMAQAVEITGRSKTTLENYARVARAIPPARRRRNLSFNHHRLVSARKYSPEQQEEWLDKAEANKWSVEEFDGALNAIVLTDPGQEALPAGPLDQHVNRARLHETALIIARQANPLGDGRYVVDGELIAQLRAAAGLER
jgi:hypothetical protein